ncbi:hypothetical protein [Gelidibacter sp.]|uniref:hypothetical protein n=1 Tax=Gelidibacter sp. TaxID=2018083 RepID=UPI002D1449CC|nr:hypothetical protein [Gelidibacter sp.]HUH27210.1 hypothetical protein [Gelidibacter sp.]
MDISLNVVMLVVVLIVIVPFAWFIMAERSAVSKKKKAFQKIAQAQNLNLSQVEYWNNHCLGYDAQENTLLHNNLNTPDSEFEKVELDDVRKCVINKINKDYKNGDKHYSEMMRLELEFTFVSNRPPVTITLYNNDDNFSQNQEVARAEKWLALINKHKYNKNNVVAA